MKLITKVICKDNNSDEPDLVLRNTFPIFNLVTSSIFLYKQHTSRMGKLHKHSIFSELPCSFLLTLMARKKVDLTFITKTSKRKATFKKRKNGSNHFFLFLSS